MFSNDYMQGFRRDYDNEIDININNANMNTNMNTNMNYQEMAGGCPGMAPMMGCPVTEMPQERVVHRNFMHEVPHL